MVEQLQQPRIVPASEVLFAEPDMELFDEQQSNSILYPSRGGQNG